MTSGQLSALNSYRRRRDAGYIRPSTEDQRRRNADTVAARAQYIESRINPCYLKEARAILAGTKKRINRCQKLIGDDR
jgi:hypothetical protein